MTPPPAASLRPAAPDDAACREAYLRRDARFDGRFFAGVVTTGVFCRPVCPARRPRREHLRIFPTARDAERAGFRPCRRCRPESAPGSAAWRGTRATVARALRLIDDGALDARDVGALAAKLGLGERQLRRLFATWLGGSPSRVARARRAERARRLLEDSDRPLARVALDAGFGSVRQFNSAIRSAFGSTPSALRARARERRPT
jgi:AraC family transcriptional regulator of adaptative response / DNA-3-methyladenine glycosylase II